MRTFQDNQVLAQSSGQCEQCKRKLATILVLDDGERKWFAVEWRNRGNCWVEHRCPEMEATSIPAKAAA